MRIAIVQFPGSQGEQQTRSAVQRAGMEPVVFLWNQPAADLTDFAGYIIIGGFSADNASRPGAIAALSPLLTTIRLQSELGKPVLGINQGAQILVEAGLVPGIEGHKVGLALTDNQRVQEGSLLGLGFYEASVHMRLANVHQHNAFTRFLTPKTILSVPVADSEGRFVIPPGLLAEMQMLGLGVFQYCDTSGEIVESFPTNPNGSVNNIGAVSNKAGNVMAMIPHPERTIEGDAIFQSMRDYIVKGHVEHLTPLHYFPRSYQMKRYVKPVAAQVVVIEGQAVNNQAIAIENALNESGMSVKIKQQSHWEMACDSVVYDKILQSGVLDDSGQAMVTDASTLRTSEREALFLVRAKDDGLGQQKIQQIRQRFGIDSIQSLRHSVLWSVSSDQPIAPLVKRLLNTPILFNPFSHDCYYY